MAKSLRKARKKAKAAVNSWSAGAVGLSWVPGSTLALGAADLALVRKVAKLYEVDDWSKEAILSSMGKRYAGKKLAAEAAGLIPIAGWAVKASVAGSLTKAFGEAVIKYFESQTDLK